MPSALGELDSRDRKGEHLKDRRWSAAAPILSFLAFLGVPTAMSMVHPPRVFTSWVVVSAISFLAVAVALWSSSRTSRRKLHVLQAAAVVVALGSLGAPVMSYFKSFNDLPWLLLVPLLLLLIVGGWKCRQRWLTVVCVAIVAFFFVTARAPHEYELPKSLAKDGVTVAVESISSSGAVTFTVRSAPGTRIEDELDLRNIELEGTVCRVLPLNCRRPRSHLGIEEELQPNEARLTAKTFPPDWSRTFDLSARILQWPPEAAASVTVPVPMPGDEVDYSLYGSAGGGIQLSVTRVRWSRSRNRSTKEEVLALTIWYEGYSYSGWKGTELRVRDQNGRTMRLHSTGTSGSAGGSYQDCEILNVPPGTTEITVDAFSEEQRERALVHLRFGRLPIG